VFDVSLKKKKKKKKTPFDLDAATEAGAENDQPETEEKAEDDSDLASFGGKKKKTQKKLTLEDDEEGDKENIDGRSNICSVASALAWPVSQLGLFYYLY
jgi:translation initiation factor 2 subunit 2